MHMFVEYDHNIHKAVKYEEGDTPQQRQEKQNAHKKMNQKHADKVNNREKTVNKYQQIDKKFNNKWNKARKRIIKETSFKVQEKMRKETEEASGEEAKLLEERNAKEKDEIIKEVVEGRKFTLYLHHLRE